MHPAPTPGARPLLAIVAAIVVGFWLQRFVFAEAELLRGTSDLRNYFFPLYAMAYGWLGEGSLPHWNPFHLGGYPQLATLQGGFFYPPHLLYVVLSTPHALAVSQALHLAWLAATTAWLARRLGLGTWAAGLVAILFTLRGSVQWWLLWPPMLETASWLPLGCAAAIELGRGGRGRWVALLAFASGMALLAGHAQVGGYLVWTWGTLLVATWLANRTGPAEGLWVALRFGAAMCVGVAIAAVQVAPVVELTLDGTRQLGALPASQVLAMGPGGFRSLVDAIFMSQFSFGSVALALAPAALVLRRHRPLAIWALALAVASALLAGAASEAAVEVYRSIPGIGWFRSPRRILFVTGFAVAVLAGLGLDALWRCAPGDPDRDRARIAAGVAAFVAFVLSRALLVESAWVSAGVAVAVAVFAAAAACALLRDPRSVRAIVVGIVALAGVELVLAETARGRLPYTERDAAVYRENEEAYRELARRAGSDRVVALPLPRLRDLKLAGAFGLRRLDDFEPLNLRRQSEYFTYFQHGRSQVADAKRFFSGDVIPELRRPAGELREMSLGMASRRRLLDLAATRWFITATGLGPVQQQFARDFVSAAGLEPAEPVPGFSVAGNPHAVPRAFVTYRTRPAPETDELLGILSRPSFDPLETSYVEGAVELVGGSNAPTRGSSATIVRDDAALVEIEATLEAPGLLVLADSFYPGWRAEVDGVVAPIVATNHLFRGVAVEAGPHRVRFSYRPRSLWVGALASALGIVALVAIARQR